MASTGDVELDTSFSGGRGLFSGEGLFLLRASSNSGRGTIWFDSYGAVKRLEITHGSELVVDTGHMVAFTEGVDYSIGKVGGIRSLIGGGEGLVMKFRGSAVRMGSDPEHVRAGQLADPVPAEAELQVGRGLPQPPRQRPPHDPLGRARVANQASDALRNGLASRSTPIYGN